MNQTFTLIMGMLGGACLAGLTFLAWWLNMRYRNLRNAVLEFGQQIQHQEDRYGRLAVLFLELSERVAEFDNMPQTSRPVDVGQPEAVNEVVNAWTRILKEDESPP